MAGVFVNALPTLRDYGLGIRNSASLLFVVWVWLLDIARMVVPSGLVPFVVLESLDLLHLFLGVVTVEALVHDVTVTNMACTALVGCDGCFVLYGVVYRVYGEIQARLRSRAQEPPKTARVIGMPPVPSAPEMPPGDGIELTFNAPGIHEINLNWGVFEKKIK